MVWYDTTRCKVVGRIWIFQSFCFAYSLKHDFKWPFNIITQSQHAIERGGVLFRYANFVILITDNKLSPFLSLRGHEGSPDTGITIEPTSDETHESTSRLSRMDSAKQDIKNLKSATLGRMGKIFKIRPPTPSEHKTANDTEQEIVSIRTKEAISFLFPSKRTSTESPQGRSFRWATVRSGSNQKREDPFTRSDAATGGQGWSPEETLLSYQNRVANQIKKASVYGR